MAISDNAALEPGRVIRMRNRLWRVDNVRPPEFTATPIDGRDTQARRFLAEVEDVSEGALPPPDPALASDPAYQELLLRAFRLSLVHGSAPLMGLQRSRAIPTPYQLVPLLLAIGKERVRLLIADDVGVGKTIEMGLVVSELVARGLVRRALFIVPANLREQTRDALAHFFHLDSTIVAGHLMRGLERQLMPGQSVWRAHPFVVVSVDYAKRNQGKILDANWDLVVIDEAHLCARPRVAPGARRAADMLRHEIAAKAAAAATHLILMTATPHDGHIESFASLIDLLDVGAVTWPYDGRPPAIEYPRAAPHVVQRRREDIRSWFEESGERYPFPRRDQDETVVKLGRQEHAVLAALRDYTSVLVGHSSAPINGWVALHLQKRALSSPAALRRSLENRAAALRRRLAEEAGSPADAEIAVMDEEGGDDLTDEQRFARVDRSALSDPATELNHLDGVLAAAKKVTAAKDAKLRLLLDSTLPHVFARQRNKRVIVFTRYRDTLDYVVGQVRARAGRAKSEEPLHGATTVEIHGEMNPADRRAALAAFEAADRAVLVATDCISEGMNLQRACAALVHYELPWNPNRLEQRNGRIDRYRQPEPSITIRTLVCDDQLDFTILNVLVTKARRIREEYGFSPPFFSSSRELLELMRRHGHAPVEQLDLFSQATESSDGPDELDVLSAETAERIRTQSFYGHQTVTLGEVQRALTETARTVGTQTEVERFVMSGLSYLTVPARALGADVVEIDVGASTLLSDLAPEGEVLRVTFDPAVGEDEPGIEVLDLAHPLVRRLVDQIRDEGTGALGDSQRGRLTAYGHPATSVAVALIQVLARFTSSSSPPVLMEELVPVAFPLWDERPGAVDRETTARLLGPGARAIEMLPRDLEEAAQRVLDHPALENLVAEALEQRRSELLGVGARVASAAGDWAEGLDELHLASRDVLTIAVIEPADEVPRR